MDDFIIENGVKLGQKEPFDPNNPDHKDPTKYKIYEGDVGEHTFAAIKTNTIPDSIINMSLLFHDLGKAETYELRDGWRHSYFRHEFVSGKIIERIAKRLKFSIDEREAIKFAAVNHMKFHHIVEMKISKVVDLMKSPFFNVLKQVAFCDDSCRLHVFDQMKWNEVINKITEIETSWGQTMKKTKIVDGHHVMELLNIKSGKLLGDIIKETTTWIFDTGITDQEEVDKKIREIFEQKNN